MIPSEHLVMLSRWQFGLTASFHFLFVPLTLGLSWILLIMETVYIITGKQVYKDMTKFWGKLFGINFVMGVITGLTLEFQFGTNWAYFSQYIGDVFGVPLAIEGMSAFMLESALFGIFFFGWEKVSRTAHWFATLALAVGSSLSGLIILVANGYMQHPVGAHFDFTQMRVVFGSWTQLWLNPDAQVRFVHTVAAGYVAGAMFVIAISAYYILKGRDLPFAKRSFAIAAGFGLASVLSVIVLGDAAGIEVNRLQPAKMAAIEAVWKTPKAPAAWSLFAIPDQKLQKNFYDIQIPWALSLIATHSLSETVEGMKQIIQNHKKWIREGMKAYGALEKMKKGDASAETLSTFKQYQKYLGYGLLLKPYTTKVINATPRQINQAANRDIPDVFTLFWSFRIMVFCALFMLLLFLTGVFFGLKQTLWKKKWLLRIYLYSLPLPWFATTAGWFIAEHGRQPWLVDQILPTSLGASTISSGDVVTSLIGFTFFYSILFVVELFLMFKYARVGPSSLHTGRYHFEKLSQEES